MKLFTN